MQEHFDLMEKLNPEGRPLTKGQERIARFIAEHYNKAAFMTVAALAESCGVSESTVVRFATQLGYPGYPEMREDLLRLARQKLTSEQRFEIAAGIDPASLPDTVLQNDERNIRRTMDSLSPKAFHTAVEKLISARRVYIVGIRSAAPLAQFMYIYLHQILEDVVLVESTLGDVFEEIARISPQDVLVGISFPRYSARTMDCIRFARSRGAQIVTLTDSELSPLYGESDACLCAATDMASFVDSLAAPLSVINALIVSVALQCKDKLSDHFKQLEGIWNAHSVYMNQKDE